MKTILVTGGSRGIGKAIADKLQQSGFEVLAPSSKELDVSSNESIKEFFTSKLTNKNFFALISNAGIYESGSSENFSLTTWSRIIEVNLTGAFKVTQAAIPLLKQSSNSHIIYVSSVSAQGESYASAYSASKGALNSLCRSLAFELASDGINVNAIAPGWVKTDMALDILNTDSKVKANLGATLQNRWIEADEIADLVLYLINQKAITGQIINIDAGL